MKTLDATTEELLKQRMEERYKQGRLLPVYTIDPETGTARRYTPDDIINEVRTGTTKGDDFLLSEKKLMDELKKRL